MPDPEMAEFAGEIQKLAEGGSFDPFTLLAGETKFHSAFLAPFSPSLKKSIVQFCADGSGPLVDVVKVFQRDGLGAAEAALAAKRMFESAQGMLVAVLGGDHGLSTIPQLHFGHLEEGFCEHAVKSCGDKFPNRPALTAALADLRAKLAGGTVWPGLIAGPGAGGNVAGYWQKLGEEVVLSLDQGMGPGHERLRDLAHWVGAAIAVSGRTPDDAGTVVVARCHLIAGESEPAAAHLDRLLREDADADALAELVVHLADAAIREGRPEPTLAWLERFLPKFEGLFGKCYELRLATFKLHTAAAAPAAKLLAAAAALIQANRKSARQDLTREPIWRVVAEPGPLLDTNAAAAAIGRSSTFIAKRLEQGTIPSHRQGDQVRIPAAALAAWKAVMDEHKLLE
jgi:hypothetical protein